MPTVNYGEPTPTVNHGTISDDSSTSGNRRTADSPVGHGPDEVPGASRDREPIWDGEPPPERPEGPGEPTGEPTAQPDRDDRDGDPLPMPNQATANAEGSAAQTQPQAGRTQTADQTRTATPPRLGVKTTRAKTKIATLNIRGGGSATTRHKWQKINQIMRTDKIGVLVVNEAHLKDEDVDSLHEQYPSRLHILNNLDSENPASKGIAIILNKQLVNWKEATMTKLIVGRASLLNIPWHGRGQLKILAVYAPNNHAENAGFWESLHDEWDANRLPLPDMMIGDFNMVEEAIDRLPAHRDPPRVTEALERLKARLRLQDGWRQQHPTELNYTYTQTATQSRSRIDRIYMSDTLLKGSHNWQSTITEIRTDHKMLAVECANWKAPKIGRGRWAIPPRTLKSRHVIQKIRTLGMSLETAINQIPQDETWNGGRSVQQLFESFKKDIIAVAKDYSRVATPMLDHKIKILNKKLTEALNDQNAPLEEKQLNASVLEEELTKLESIRHERIRDNTKSRFWLEGETISKYWIGLNKAKTPRDTIPSLQVEVGTGGTRQEKHSEKMADIARDYHENLQSAGLVDDLTEEEVTEVLQNLDTTLPASEKRKLAEYIKEEEISQAIKDLPEGKAPGPDGIPHELWKTFHQRHLNDVKANQRSFNIVRVLTRIYNDIERHGIDPATSFSKGWMCPIYKKGDKTQISNYRPITVLNSDYKIMTRALTTRLTSAVPSLIHSDQAGFMKGRRIEDQTDLVQLMLNRCEAEEDNGVIVCLDQEKAYDKIRHDFIWRTLEKLQFPDHFIRTVKTLYSNGTTCVIVNGMISNIYKVIRGVRQGDPLSCLIFNLAIESLASMLRKSQLKGFNIPGDTERLITTLFADDTTVYLSEEDDLEILHSILQKWCRSSGAKFNVDKTTYIPAGAAEYRVNMATTRKIGSTQVVIPDNIQIAADGTPVRVLGAFVGNNVDSLAVWAPRKEKIRDRLQQWNKSKPTMRGRRLIIGMEVGGLTQYLTRVQGMEKGVEDSITKMIREFMWNGESPTVGLETLELPANEGGMKLLNLSVRNEAIQLMKLKTYLQPPQLRPRWTKVADSLLASNTPKSQERIDNSQKINMYLQSWKPKTSGNTSLPKSLRNMLATAKKYRLSLDPPLIDIDIRRHMPIWYHKGTMCGKTVSHRGQAIKCLKSNHKVQEVGELIDFLEEDYPPEHRCRGTCLCNYCNNMRLIGCRSPKKCRKAAKKALDTLQPRWDPRIQQEQGRPTPQPFNEDETEIQKQMSTGSDLWDEFRIFSTPRHQQTAQAIRAPTQPGHEPRTVHIKSRMKLSKEERPRAMASLWHGENDERNSRFTSAYPNADTALCEMEAVLLAVQRSQPDEELRIMTSSRRLKKTLTTDLTQREDEGWLKTKHGEVFQATIAAIRAKPGQVTLTRVSKLDQQIIKAEELALAEENEEETIAPPQIQGYESFLITGARLSSATQASLYNAIMRQKEHPTRRQTETNLDIARHGVATIADHQPTNVELWNSTTTKDLGNKISTFLWKTIHNAYKCGSYWEHITGYEERGMCHTCGTPDTVEHALLACRASGQEHIWRMAEQLWHKRGLDWVRPTLGTILGCGLARFHPEGNKRRLTGANRLYALLTSLSFKLAWNLSRKHKIEHEEDPNKILPREAVERLWLRTINARLKLDCLMTNKIRYGNKALQQSLVEKTWDKVLDNQLDLPPDWSRSAGVLVSIGGRSRVGVG